MKISASILNCNFLQLESEIKKAEEAGVDSFHLDVMDGHFVPNLSFGTPILKSVKLVATKPIFSHLMVLAPEKMIEYFLADSSGVIFHIEATENVQECINLIHRANKICGIAINPETSYLRVLPYLPDLDEILFMTVHPGFGGQEFIKAVVPRIKELAEIIKREKLPVSLSVDGGVNKDNLPLLREAGVDKIIVGTFLFRSPDYKRLVAELRCLM